ncbi:CIS tube protein [Massilia sp. S19_KUP03_FR1]|uniref:CIS tube protein n=1 Tax=Massilia sp. S19_KUP03_FR1 TaxID=3025503 RepID=UPI002FCDA5AF
MAEQLIVRAELIELKDDLSDVLPGGMRVPVQFNPESFKLSYANQIQAQPNASSKAPPRQAGRGAGNQSQGTPARQFVGAGTTKLTVQLTFDVSAATTDTFLNAEGKRQSGSVFMIDDVRYVTGRVLYFMKPKDPGAGAKDASQRVPPGLRFSWGKFLFDGIVESIEENVDFFSADGKALRASMTLNMIQQTILVPAYDKAVQVTRPQGGAAAGATPLAKARSGQSMQQLSDSGGGGGGFGFGVSASLDVGGGIGGGVGGVGGAIGVGVGLHPGAGAALGAGLAVSSGVAFEAGSWQRIAAANGIENPRTLAPGQFIDLAAQRPRIVTG